MVSNFSGGRPVAESLKEYARGVVGGLIFSFPMLYTMEVWWAGFIAGPPQFVALIVVTFLLLLGYNRYAGMRPGSTWRSIMVDSVEEMGIGLILSFGILLMLKRIAFEGMGLDEIMGKVVIEAMAASIGVSVGTAQLGGNGAEEEDEADRGDWVATAVLALCGAILVGGNVAPTEEIVMIAVEAGAGEILAMVIFSLLLSVVVVYFSNFRGAAREAPKNAVYSIIFDVCLSYSIALVSSAFVLWFFGRFANVSLEIVLAQCVVLGVIATLGASAGRLLIK